MARLGLNQLVELGITLVGHQKKINNSIQVTSLGIQMLDGIFFFFQTHFFQAIRAQLSVNVSEGFLV